MSYLLDVLFVAIGIVGLLTGFIAGFIVAAHLDYECLKRRCQAGGFECDSVLYSIERMDDKEVE